MDIDKIPVSLEEMIAEAELFRFVYPDLIGEIKRGEQAHGRLNEFQLTQAVAHAKNGLGVISFERRQTINAIFETFTEFYRYEGRHAAELWALDTFGCDIGEAGAIRGDIAGIAAQIEELSEQIRELEARLLPLYRKYHMLQSSLANGGRRETSRGEQN